MAFWGKIVKGTEAAEAVIPEDVVLTLTQVALAKGKDGERVVLKVKVDDKEFVVCTLASGKTEQAKVLLLFESSQNVSFTLSNSSAEVHLTGYFVENDQGDDFDDSEDDEDDFEGVRKLRMGEEDDGDDDEDEDEDVEDEEDEDEDEKPAKAGEKRPAPGKQAAPVKKLKSDEAASTNGGLKCPQCNKSMKSELALVQHNKDVHGEGAAAKATTPKPQAKVAAKVEPSKATPKADAKVPAKPSTGKAPAKAPAAPTKAETKSPAKAEAKNPAAAKPKTAAKPGTPKAKSAPKPQSSKPSTPGVKK